MTDRLAKWAAGYYSIDRVLFAMAEEMAGEKLSGSWHDYTYPDDYIVEKKQGTRPSTFKGFLEGHSWQLRQMGYPCSAGDLEEHMEIYVACAGLGITTDEMAFLSAKLLKAIRRAEHLDFDAEVKNALEVKKLTGSYYLPSYDKPGVIKYSIETRELPDGRIQTIAFNSIRDGAVHRNFFADRGELHHFLMRTRASHIELPDSVPGD